VTGFIKTIETGSGAQTRKWDYYWFETWRIYFDLADGFL